MSDVAVAPTGAFASLRYRDYAVFWSAALVSNTGSWMQSITVPYVIDQLTHSTLWVGVAAFVNFVPALAVGPLAGSLADRLPRKRILLMTQTVMMLVAFSLWGFWLSGAATTAIVLGNLLVSSLASGINLASWQSFVPQLMPADAMLNAVRLNSMQFTAARAFGPALAGLVLASLGASDAFLLNAISFVLVLLALATVHPRSVQVPYSAPHFLDHFRDGIAYVRARSALVLAVLTIVMLSFFGSAVVQLSEPLARRVFHVGAGRYGLMVAVFGGGAILGSLFSATYGDVVRRSRLTLVGLGSFAASELVLGAAPTFGIALVGLAGMGLAYLLCSVSLNTAIQARVDESHRGRVLSIFLIGLLAGIPSGALTMSAVAEGIGLRATVIGGAVVLAGFVVLTSARFDRFAPLDETLARAPGGRAGGAGVPQDPGAPDREPEREPRNERVVMHVDSHTHLVSLDEDRYPLNPMSMTGPWYHEEPCPAERMLELGDQSGVDRVVVVQAFSAYQYDNRYAADVARQYPERFTSVAIVDLGAADPAGELRRLVVKEGMRGLRWWGLASPSVAEPRSVWDTAAELGIPVVMTVLADRLVELAEALPGLPPVPVALDHCGFSDFAAGIPDALSALAAFPNLALKVSTHTLDEMAKHGDAAEGVAELAASFGADRMMWGSDYPQTHDRPYAELVEWGRRGASRLDDAGRAAFLGGTALRYWPELAA